MQTRNRILATIGAVALTLAIALVAVFAGGVGKSSAAPVAAANPAAIPAAPAAPAAQATGPLAFGMGGDMTGFLFGGMGAGMPGLAFGTPGDRQATCDDFAKKVAANLGVSSDQLQAAVKKAMLDEIDAAQASGKLTADQAKQLKDRINASSDGFCARIGAGPAAGAAPAGRPGGPGLQGGAMGLFDDSMVKAAAGAFGISTDQLKQDLKDQGSLQGVAKKYQKDTAEGKAGLETALENALRQQLKDRGVTQIDQVVSAFKQNFDRLYTMPLGQGVPGGHPGMPGGGPRGPRGPQPSPAPTN